MVSCGTWAFQAYKVTIAFILLSIHLQAQTSLTIMERGQYLQLPILPREYLHFPNIQFEQVFNSSKFLHQDFDELPDEPAMIKEIILTFTDFQLSESFSQSALNKKRIDQFAARFPKICADKKVTWKFIAQTAAKNEDEAKKYFHGFIIVPKIERTEISRSTELKMISEVSKLMSSKVVRTDTVLKIKCRKRFSGKYLPASKRKAAEGITYNKRSVWKRKRIMTETCDTFQVVQNQYKPVIKSEAYSFVTDTIVSAVLNRNTHWRDLSLVIDVTGSMSPYIADVILWANMNQHWRKVKRLTCFNDGDQKLNNFKIIGKTGGIYQKEVDSSDVFESLVYSTMRKGGGGDAPENDLEAVLNAQDQEKAGEIILVCDNWSPVRDIELIRQVNLPIHIIVCGSAYKLIHPDYIKIAFETGGSVHTMEDDFTELYKHLDGDVIKLGNSSYRLRNGEFKLLSYN